MQWRCEGALHILSSFSFFSSHSIPQQAFSVSLRNYIDHRSRSPGLSSSANRRLVVGTHVPTEGGYLFWYTVYYYARAATA